MEITYDPTDASLDSLIRAPSMDSTLHALIQPSSGRIMALSSIQDTIMTLAHTDGVSLFKINKPTLGKPVLLKRFIGWPWEWQFNTVNRIFEHNPKKDEYEEHYKIRIVTEKAALLDIINGWIGNTRQAVASSVNQQQIVREKKANEASKFLENTHQQLDHFPYLKQHMSIFNVSADEAAHAIAMQSKQVETLLFETENIRLKYSKAARDSRSIAEVRALYFDFLAERNDSSQYSFIIS